MTVTPNPSASEAKTSHQVHQVALPFVSNTTPACYSFWGSKITHRRVCAHTDGVFSCMLQLLALSITDLLRPWPIPGSQLLWLPLLNFDPYQCTRDWADADSPGSLCSGCFQVWETRCPGPSG